MKSEISSGKSRARAVGALVGAVALVGSGVTVAHAGTAHAENASLPSAVELDQRVPGASYGLPMTVRPGVVEGVFGFSQEAVTPTSRIAAVFRVAASSLCSDLSDYQAELPSGSIRVGGGASQERYAGTVSDMEDEQGTTVVKMGCACSTNAPGGGAIANAEVSGVSLESLMDRAGVIR